VLPSDITKLRTPSTPTLVGDPRDGGLLLVAVSTPDLETDENRSAILRVTPSPDTADAVVPWTSGTSDSEPVISPDGRWVLFVRPVADDAGTDRPQLHVIPTDGGEARVVTALPLGIGSPVWSPDSRRIAGIARIPEPGRYGTAGADGRRPSAAAEAPRHVDRLDFHGDGRGYTLDQPAQLVVVDLDRAFDSPVAEPLTNVSCSLSMPVWTPDGTGVLVAAPRDLGVRETLRSDLYLVPVSGDDAGTPSLAVRSAGEAGAAAFGSDDTLFYLGSSDESVVAEPNGLWATRLGSDAAPVRLTDRATVELGYEPTMLAVRAHDVLVGALHRGAVEVRSVPWTGSAPATPLTLDELPVVLGGHVVVRGFRAVGDLVVASVATTTSAGEVVLVDGDTTTTLTDLGADVRAAGVRPIEELTGTSADGTPVHGWLVLPDGDGPHPVLRVVHGGPNAQDTWALFDEAQVYAAAGYAVVIGNPRGSAGYGLEHGRAVIGAMGTVDVDDVLALLDAALERDDLDGDRVGIMGGSYGGFMTSWLAAHHGDRFVAAWSERAVNAWDSFAGSSDIGWFFADAYVGADPEEQRRRSPLTFADRVTIPFMVAHSENDWRCPIEQGQRQFVALRRAGVPAELLVFPGEGHELSRSGRPNHRVQRFEHVLAWWARHLPVAAS
jgi:dipeptidyl aminopeptidase/acylaminoacyl peptidase